MVLKSKIEIVYIAAHHFIGTLAENGWFEFGLNQKWFQQYLKLHHELHTQGLAPSLSHTFLLKTPTQAESTKGLIAITYTQLLNFLHNLPPPGKI